MNPHPIIPVDSRFDSETGTLYRKNAAYNKNDILAAMDFCDANAHRMAGFKEQSEKHYAAAAAALDILLHGNRDAETSIIGEGDIG